MNVTQHETRTQEQCCWTHHPERPDAKVELAERHVVDACNHKQPVKSDQDVTSDGGLVVYVHAE